MSAPLLSPENIGSLISLAALETVLGIDNIIFLSILVGKLPPRQQAVGRRLGLVLALGMRICLLLSLSYLASRTATLFSVLGHGVSGRDLVLLVGGGFLVVKSVSELRGTVAGEDDDSSPSTDRKPGRGLALTLVQITLMDIVFSLDSVITAVGLARSVGIMIAAMVLAMLVMLGFAKAIGDFVARHPGMKVLALTFLVMVGSVLVIEGGGLEIPKGYVYAAMGFSFMVELLNMRMRHNLAVNDVKGERNAEERHLEPSPRATRPTPSPSKARLSLRRGAISAGSGHSP